MRDIENAFSMVALTGDTYTPEHDACVMAGITASKYAPLVEAEQGCAPESGNGEMRTFAKALDTLARLEAIAMNGKTGPDRHRSTSQVVARDGVSCPDRLQGCGDRGKRRRRVLPIPPARPPRRSLDFEQRSAPLAPASPALGLSLSIHDLGSISDVPPATTATRAGSRLMQVRQSVLIHVTHGQGLGADFDESGRITALHSGGALVASRVVKVGDQILEVNNTPWTSDTTPISGVTRVTISRSSNTGPRATAATTAEPKPPVTTLPSPETLAKLKHLFGRDPTPILMARQREERFSVRRGVRYRRRADTSSEEKIHNLLAAIDTSLLRIKSAKYSHRFSKQVELSDKNLWSMLKMAIPTASLC